MRVEPKTLVSAPPPSPSAARKPPPRRSGQVLPALVAPCEVLLVERQRPDDRVTARLCVCRIVAVLRFAAAHVAAGNAGAEIHARAAFLALIRTRRCRLTGNAW